MPKANDTAIIPNQSHPHTFVHTRTHTHTHTHWWTEITLTCFVNFHYPAAVGRAQSVWTFHWPTGHWSVSSTPALCCDCSVNLPSASSHLSLTWTQYTNTIQNSACWLLRRSASNFFMSVFNMNTTNSVFLTTLQSCLQLLHVCLTWTPYINTILCADCSADLPSTASRLSDLNTIYKHNTVCWLLCRPAFVFCMSIWPNTIDKHNTKLCVLTALQTCLCLLPVHLT